MFLGGGVRLQSVGMALAALVTMVCSGPAVSAEPKPVNREIPWDVSALSKPPKVHPADARPAKGMVSMFYEGAEYKGKPTWVFAYFATPGGTPPAGLERPQVDPQTGVVHVKCTGELKMAWVYFTTSGGPWKDRRWAEMACDVRENEVIARQGLPKETTAFIVNAYDKRDGLVSSELIAAKR